MMFDSLVCPLTSDPEEEDCKDSFEIFKGSTKSLCDEVLKTKTWVEQSGPVLEIRSVEYHKYLWLYINLCKHCSGPWKIMMNTSSRWRSLRTRYWSIFRNITSSLTNIVLITSTLPSTPETCPGMKETCCQDSVPRCGPLMTSWSSTTTSTLGSTTFRWNSLFPLSNLKHKIYL